jgi:hypothetical protein
VRMLECERVAAMSAPSWASSSEQKGGGILDVGLVEASGIELFGMRRGL